MAKDRLLLSNDHDYLCGQLADRFEERPASELSPAALRAIIAIADMDNEVHGGPAAPVLSLVGNRPT